MRHRFSVGLLFSLCLSTACAPASSPPSATAPVGGGGSAVRVERVPPQVGDFRRVDVHRFPQRELGVAYRYSDGTPVRLDVYVYPVGEQIRAAGGTPAEQARIEGRLLGEGLEAQQRQGVVRSFQILSDSAVQITAAGNLLHGSHITARVDVRGRNEESHQHVFVVGDQFVKVRTSFTPRAVPLARIEAFVRELLDSMTTPESAVTEVVRAPRPIEWSTAAEIHGDHLFGATRDELGIPNAVPMRIVRE